MAQRQKHKSTGDTLRAHRISSPLLKSLINVPVPTTPDVELIEKFKAGDAEAGNALFLKHYKMILRVVLDITGGKWYDDDCMHAGCVGMYEAVRRFDPTLGFTFLTYAVPWIRKMVLIEVCNDAIPGGITFGRDFKDRLFRYIGLSMLGYNDDEIAVQMRLTNKAVAKLSKAAHDASRPVELTVDMAEEQSDIIEGPEAESLKLDIEKALVELPDEISKTILEYLLGLNGKKTLPSKEIAKLLGLSAPEFNEARRKALRILRKHLRGW